MQVAREAAEATGLTLEFGTIDPGLHPGLKDTKTNIPLLPIERRMLPPWRLGSMTDKAGRILKND